MGVGLEIVVRAVQHIAQFHFGIAVDAADAEAFLRPILFEPRSLLAAAEIGIVAEREVAAGLCARTFDWLVRRSGRPHPSFTEADAEAVIEEFRAAVFAGAGHGPRA